MRTVFKKLIRWVGYILLAVVIVLSAFLWFGTYHPAEIESMAVACPEFAPTVKSRAIAQSADLECANHVGEKLRFLE